MSDERIDIAEHVRAICRLLGLDPHLTRQLVLEPRRVEATIFRTRDGEKYVERGEAAVERLTIEVIT